MKSWTLACTVAAALSGCGNPAPPAMQGYVEGEYVRIAAPFSGTLVALDAQRGSQVSAGSPLFALESENEDSARREAGERVKRAQAQAEDLRKGRRPTEITAARAQLAQAQVASSLSERDYARQLDLVSKGFVSQSRADEARAARDRDRGKLAEINAELQTVLAGTRPDEIRAAEAEAAAARESFKQADWRLRQRSVAATVGGTVTDTLFVRGEWVPAGSPVVTVLPPGNVKVRFFVPEPRLGALKLGQKVSIACDACGTGLEAVVAFISPQAEFTPPVIYSKDNRAKMVFLVEARPAAEHAARLHPGQPVDVTLP